MKHILGVLFLIVTTSLLLVVVYCVGIAVMGAYGYFGVAAGVGLTCTVSGFITNELLKQR